MFEHGVGTPRRLSFLSLFALTAAGIAQTPPAPPAPQLPEAPQAPAPDEEPFAKPFRFADPKKDVVLQAIEPALADLETLRQHWHAAKQRGYDTEGRPDCELPHFKTLRDRIRANLEKERKAGLLKMIVEDDRSPARRRAAHFGVFFVPDVQDALHLVYFMPREPSTEVRREMVGHAAAFLGAQLGQRQGEDENAPYHYQFDALPWVDLTRAPSAADRALAFGALAQIVRARAEMGTLVMEHVRRWLPDCLRADSAELRRAIADFVQAVDPQTRLPAEPDAAIAELAKLCDRLFPSIRVHGGIGDLRPGADRDRLVEVGRDALRRGTIAQRWSQEVTGRLGKKTIYGLRLFKPPEPLDKLGLVEGDVLTALDGTPLDSCEQLLKMLEEGVAAKKKSFVLEWCSKDGTENARRYNLHQ